MSVRQHTQDVRGCLWLSVSTHRTSVCVCQHTQDVRGCACVSVCVCQHTHDACGCPSVHISACSGNFGPRGLSVQYTQDVPGCPPAHTGRPWLSVCVRLCPSAHTGRPWLSLSTHISTLVLGLSTLALPVDCLGYFGQRGLSVQYTQDVRGCLPAHTGRPWLSVSTHRTSVAVRVCPSPHTGRPRLSISTHISTLVLGLSTLALPVDCSGDFGPRGLSVQYTRRPWVSFSTHRTSVALRLHTQDVFGCPFVSVGVR